MPVRIPGVRGKGGASPADLILEHIELCRENVKTIERIATHQKKREMRNEINKRIRACNNLLGMTSGSRRFGHIYRETDLQKGEKLVSEHVIPVSELTSLYENGAPLEELIFYPIALISNASNALLNKRGLNRSRKDCSKPFSRYSEAGIKVESHLGREVETKTWGMADHWDLINETQELANIMDAVYSRSLSHKSH